MAFLCKQYTRFFLKCFTTLSLHMHLAIFNSKWTRDPVWTHSRLSNENTYSQVTECPSSYDWPVSLQQMSPFLSFWLIPASEKSNIWAYCIYLTITLRIHVTEWVLVPSASLFFYDKLYYCIMMWYVFY